MECSIEFNAKISTLSSTDVLSGSSSATGSSASSFQAGSAYRTSAIMTGAVSNQLESKISNTEQREFSMNVKVRATQAEMPAGMKRVLSELEEAIF